VPLPSPGERVVVLGVENECTRCQGGGMIESGFDALGKCSLCKGTGKVAGYTLVTQEPINTSLANFSLLWRDVKCKS